MIPRTDSYGELFTEKDFREVCKEVDRSWSKNVSSPSPSLPSLHHELPKAGPVTRIKADHRRVQSTGNVPSEPKLVRSCGMRRNWSFEDLSENQEKRVSCR
ncbi:hypothetical protein VNO77_40238 [Canavalia gladiata]|uniref:Uncharacterized protein n=1 Tax=Canavalia gladiata TaxID=3824 RepID=A0AAN9JZR9_CANGL